MKAIIGASVSKCCCKTKCMHVLYTCPWRVSHHKYHLLGITKTFLCVRRHESWGMHSPSWPQQRQTQIYYFSLLLAHNTTLGRSDVNVNAINTSAVSAQAQWLVGCTNKHSCALIGTRIGFSTTHKEQCKERISHVHVLHTHMVHKYSSHTRSAIDPVLAHR